MLNKKVLNKKKVNLCACGSLTNLAKLFLTFPDVLENIE